MIKPEIIDLNIDYNNMLNINSQLHQDRKTTKDININIFYKKTIIRVIISIFISIISIISLKNIFEK